MNMSVDSGGGSSRSSSGNNGTCPSTKLVIEKERFRDDHFDQLVIKTSTKVTKRYKLSDSQSAAHLQDGQQLNLTLGDDEASKDGDKTIAGKQGDSDQRGGKLNQPKRPMNAFMVWGQAIRRELHHKFSNVQNALLSKALGRVWKSLEANEKEPYIRRANIIKANHKRDYPNYRYQPRRILERRSRSGMLIGINIGEPPNQQLASRHATAFNFGCNQYQQQQQQQQFLQQTYDRGGANQRSIRTQAMLNQELVGPSFDFSKNSSIYGEQISYNPLSHGAIGSNQSSSSTFGEHQNGHPSSFYDTNRAFGNQSHNNYSQNQQQRQFFSVAAAAAAAVTNCKQNSASVIYSPYNQRHQSNVNSNHHQVDTQQFTLSSMNDNNNTLNYSQNQSLNCEAPISRADSYTNTIVGDSPMVAPVSSPQVPWYHHQQTGSIRDQQQPQASYLIAPSAAATGNHYSGQYE